MGSVDVAQCGFHSFVCKVDDLFVVSSVSLYANGCNFISENPVLMYRSV